jgi:hypothetical protein
MDKPDTLDILVDILDLLEHILVDTLELLELTLEHILVDTLELLELTLEHILEHTLEHTLVHKEDTKVILDMEDINLVLEVHY